METAVNGLGYPLHISPRIAARTRRGRAVDGPETEFRQAVPAGAPGSQHRDKCVLNITHGAQKSDPADCNVVQTDLPRRRFGRPPEPPPSVLPRQRDTAPGAQRTRGGICAFTEERHDTLWVTCTGGKREQTQLHASSLKLGMRC